MSAQLLTLSALLLTAISVAHPQGVQVREETEMIMTYPFSDPDPIPILVSRPAIYPYFGFDGYTEKGVMKPWKVIHLENDYIEVTILPEVGGKVFGAREKKSGREFIYTNDALKFRRIALRGPWTSGGIEFNFGVVGHAPSTASPVDYTIRRNGDGSVTCFVGTIDLPSRTRWTVAISLAPGSAALETKAFWYNPTAFDQSYYSWSTAAVTAGSDLLYDYPGTAVIDHTESGANRPWPVQPDGRDLSLYRKNDYEGSKSNFVFGEYAPTFAATRESDLPGLGHWALYDDMPGRKVWIWSLARDGGIWENLLTDGRGQYSEPQAGRLLSQVDHEFFPPHAGDTWKELWFPVSGIGRMTTASPSVAMGMDRQGDTIRVSLFALNNIDDELVVTSEGSVVFRTPVSLRPLGHARWTFAAGRGYHSVTLPRAGLSYDEDPGSRMLQRPVRYRRPSETSPEGLFLSGVAFEKERKHEEALERYQAAIRAEPNHLRGLSRLAALYCRRGEPAKGLALAERGLLLSKFDPEANYAYAVCARQLGRRADAKETYGWAARSLAFRSTAYCQIAEILLGEGNLPLAKEYAGRALQFNPFNSNAHIVESVILRIEGKTAEARARLDALLTFDPLNHQGRFEQILLNGEMGRDRDFLDGITTELPAETILECAISYLRLGREKEALRLCESAGPHPMALLWRAYLLREAKPADSRSLLEQAVHLTGPLVFPFREEEIPVLEWGISRKPDAWVLRYYLGLVLWGKGRKSEAFDQLRLLNGRVSSSFLIARGMLAKELGRGDPLPDFERAVAIDRGSWRSWHALIGELSARGDHRRALAAASAGLRAHPDQIVLRMDRATALYAAGNDAGCLAELKGMRVLPYEGSWEAHDLFRRANLRSALDALERGDAVTALRRVDAAREFPEALGTGRPWEADERLHDLIAARAQESAGNREEADRALRRVAAFTLRHRLAWGSEHLAGATALARLGCADDLRRFVAEWESALPDDPTLRWWKARERKDHGAAAGAVAAGPKDPMRELRIRAAQLIR